MSALIHMYQVYPEIIYDWLIIEHSHTFLSPDISVEDWKESAFR